MKRLTTLVVLGALAVIAGGPALAQVSPQALQSISIPNKVETPIGPLDFFDGVPSRATAREGLRQPRPHARHGGVSRQCRCRIDVQRAYRPGRCRCQGREQDRPLRAVDGFADAGGHRQYLDLVCLHVYRSRPGWPDRHRDPARHARLSRRRLAAICWQHGRHRAGQRQGRQVPRAAARLHRQGSIGVFPAQADDEPQCSCAVRSRTA